jgi:hypothetical protein
LSTKKLRRASVSLVAVASGAGAVAPDAHGSANVYCAHYFGHDFFQNGGCDGWWQHMNHDWGWTSSTAAPVCIRELNANGPIDNPNCAAGYVNDYPNGFWVYPNAWHEQVGVSICRQIQGEEWGSALGGTRFSYKPWC